MTPENVVRANGLLIELSAVRALTRDLTDMDLDDGGEVVVGLGLTAGGGANHVTRSYTFRPPSRVLIDGLIEAAKVHEDHLLTGLKELEIWVLGAENDQ